MTGDTTSLKSGASINENIFLLMDKINQNLRDTTDIMHKSLIKMSERGMSIDEIQNKSEELLDSSNQFIMFFDPWYIRIWKNVSCCYRPWWFQCSEASEPRPLPWAKVSH